MHSSSPDQQETLPIQTSPGKNVAQELRASIPGIHVVSAGTEIPPEHRIFGTDDDAVLEHGEVLLVTNHQGQQVRVLVSKARGLPGERADVLQDSLLNTEVQEFAATVRAALRAESELPPEKKE